MAHKRKSPKLRRVIDGKVYKYYSGRFANKAVAEKEARDVREYSGRGRRISSRVVAYKDGYDVFYRWL